MKIYKILIIFSFLTPCFLSAFTAEVLVDTGSASINALEATINFPLGTRIDEIYNGGSAIIFWIKSPTYDDQSRTISFSGITPGGFSGEKMILLFSGEFVPEDLSHITFSDITALENDGLGTSVPVKFVLTSKEVVDDTIPPESFSISVSSVEEAFEGKRFLSFAAQDKGNGIEHYEYASIWFFPPGDEDWITVESPIVLSRKMLFQKIYIRAVDNSGNTEEASIVGPYRYATLSIGIIILICVYLCLRRLLSRYFSVYS